MGFEERLRRIEELLLMVLERLERLEEATGRSSLEARLAVEIVLAFAATAQEAINAARKIAALMEGSGTLGEDDIARAIVEVLAVKGPQSLRGLEREVRRLRGTASRTAIRSRVRMLEELGIVVVERRGRRMVVKLAGENG